ncbi:MAG: hypothetical protein GTO22_05685, partial [Gemmatimonadales bacterium]|nr:hypothetical protein [Gemmatimonadales bacterium]
SIADVTPGEVVTYDIRIDVPEGTTSSLQINDLLPDGLEILQIDVITTAAGSDYLDVDYGGGAPSITSVNGDVTL